MPIDVAQGYGPLTPRSGIVGHAPARWLVLTDMMKLPASITGARPV